MKRKTLVRIHPRERFNVRFNRKIRRGPGNVSFRHHSHFYHCPVCSRKTLVRKSFLDAHNPIPSQFSKKLQDIFNQIKLGTHEAIFDFYCGGCGRPIRLLFWEQERGMGGPWDSYVTWVLELDENQKKGDYKTFLFN